jgi:hypothetical protein
MGMKTGYMVLEVLCPNNTLAELCGPDCRVWVGEGLPTYEGTIDGLALTLPEVLAYLLERGYLRKIE